MANKDEKYKTYCVICSFDNMLVIAQEILVIKLMLLMQKLLKILGEIDIRSALLFQ